MKFVAALALPALLCATLAARGQADTPTDAQVLAATQMQSSLACPDYTAERGNPGIAAVPVAALSVLAKHKFTLCPDRRIQGEMAVLWYPKVGVFAWNPTDPAVVKTLAEIVDRISRLDDFPEALTVWNASDEELSNQTAPEFTFKPGYTP
jgi:hypothetical protein